MTTLRQTERYIRKRLKSKISKRQIGRELFISAAEVGRILEGKYPGEKVAKRLGIPVICFVCHRRVSVKKLKQVAPKIGQPGWEEFYSKKLRSRKWKVKK